MTALNYTIFAQAYGEGTYGECAYSENDTTNTCVAAGTGGNNSGSGGGLVDTGVGIVAVITFACLLVFAALVVRLWRRPQAKNSR